MKAQRSSARLDKALVRISLVPLTLIIRAPSEYIERLIENGTDLSRVLPGLTVRADPSDQAPDHEIEIRDSTSAAIVSTSSRTLIRCSTAHLDPLALAYTVLTPIVARMSARRGYFLAHAAAVSTHAGGVALTGSGKSTTSFRLAKLLSGKLIAEDNLFIVHGKEAAPQALGSVAYLKLDRRNLTERDCKDNTASYVVVSPHQVGIETATQCSLSHLFHLMPTASTEDAAFPLSGVDRISRISAFVYERAFSVERWIPAVRRHSSILAGRSTRRHDRLVEELDASLNIASVRGNVPNMAEVIARYLERHPK